MAQAGLVGAKSGGYKTIVYIICSVAALGGLLFGLDQGFIANSLETIQRHYHFGVQGGERYSSILATGGIVGALLAGVFARLLGRKRSLLLAGFIFTAASALSALLPPLPVLSACRFALGFGVGVASFVVPLFLSETAPASIRGSMGTLFQLMITIGIFLDLADQRLHRTGLCEPGYLSAAHVPDDHVVRSTNVPRRLHTPREPALADA